MPWIYRMAIKIFLLALPLFLYIGFRLSTAIAHASETSRFPVSKKTARLVVFAFILWFYLWPITLWVYQLTGNVRHLFVLQSQLQWQDYLILFPAWWGLISFVEIFPYFLVLDIFGRVSKSKIFSSKKEQTGEKKPERRWLSYLKIAVALFFLVYVGIRTYWDTNHVRIDKSQVAIENLPEEFEGLKLCLFGDVHMSRYMPGEKLDILKKTLQAGDDDLIFFTGDLNSDGLDFLGKVLKLMCQPKGKLASIACMGDHDYWTAPYKIPRDMEQCGWKFLQDRHHLIPYKGRRILVTGLTYVYSKRISRIELRRLLANAPEADLKILVVHQPRAFLMEIAAHYGYHLALAGHTHGGEVVNHLFWIPFSPGMAETPYCWGHHQYKDLQIVITNGIGRTLAPLRYHAPAQIRKLTLVKK